MTATGARGARGLLAAVTLVAAACLPATASSAAATSPSNAGGPRAASNLTRTIAQLTGTTAAIVRTAYGVPHVFAAGPGSAGYGLGYAFAQDDICTFAEDIVTLRAERSRYFGPAGTYRDVASGNASISNLGSDYYYQDVNDSGVIEAQLASAAPRGPSNEARQLVSGYAAGYDAYLANVGVANIPDSRCRGQAWVTPITALDVWRRLYQVSDLQGALELINMIAEAEPAPASAGAVRASAPKQVHAKLSAASSAAGVTPAHYVGSNGFALGSAATTTHQGMVLANPHFPWTGVNRFYEAQINIPGQLDVAGATLFGVPAILSTTREN